MRDLPAVEMEWHHGLFAHWPVAPERVRSLVPDALDVESREETAWVSALPSVVTTMRPAFAPARLGVTVPQVNFRTYVRHEGEPGVYFLSLDTESRLGVRVARAMYGLSYYRADVDFERESPGGEVEQLGRTGFGGANAGVTWAGGESADDSGLTNGGGSAIGDQPADGSGMGDRSAMDDWSATADENVAAVSGSDRLTDGPTYRFESVRWHTEEPPARFAATYRPTGRPTVADPDSLDELLAERYRAYVVRNGRVWCTRIEHRPWPLCPAEATVHADSLFEAVGLPAPAEEPIVRYSPGVAVTVRTPFRA